MKQLPANARDRAGEIRDHQIFSTYELGKMWGKSQHTIRNWIKAGALRAIQPKFASGYLVTGKEVKRFLKEKVSPDGKERD